MLGPNGSGKTTTLGMLMGVINPTAGDFSWFGQPPTNQIRKKIGAVLEHPIFYPYLSGQKNLELMAMIKEAPVSNIPKVLELVELSTRKDDKYKTYSLGMKQRLAIASALLNDPIVLILDEPTNGLDPKGQAQILELVHSLWRAYGISVVVSSHLLHDVDRICEQIIIIARGRVLVHDSLANLKARKRGAAEVVVAERHEELRQACARRQWPCELLPSGHLKVEHKSDSLNPLLQLLHELNLAPLEVIPSPNALEETFVQALELSHAAA